MDKRSKMYKKLVIKADYAKIGVFVFLIFILILMALLVNLKIQKYDFTGKSFSDIVGTLISGKIDSSDRMITEISASAQDSVAFGMCGEYILQCTKEKISGLDATGKMMWEQSIHMSSPVIKFMGEYAIVADVGGNQMVVYQGKNKRWEKKIDATLLNVDINAFGYVSYVHRSTEYKSAVTVLNPKGNEMMTKGKGENFIINARVSPDSKYLLVNIINTTDIYVNTIFERYDLAALMDKASISLKKENMIYPSVWFLGDGTVMAASDESLLCIDKSGKEKWEKKFESKVYSSNTVLGNYGVVATSGSRSSAIEGTKTEVHFYDREGKEKYTYKMDGEIKNIQTNQSQIAINAGRELNFIDSNGRYQFSYSLKKDIIDVYFWYKDRVAVLTRDGLTIIKSSF